MTETGWVGRALALLVLLGATLAGLAQSPGDELERQVLQALSDVDGLERLEVEANGGLVTLRGVTASTELLERAAAVAGTVQGVEQVDNKLALSVDIASLPSQLAPVWERLELRLVHLLAHAPLLLIAAVIVGFSWLLAGWLSRRERLYARIANVFVRDIVQKAVKSAVVLTGVLVGLELLNATALVGGVLGAAGVVGIALGFAFRDLVENYIASILLSARHPFGPDDHVRIEGAGEGLVTRLTTRSTILTTFDGNVLRIPNATVFKSSLVNYSRTPTRRFDFTVGVGYDVDLAYAMATGIDVIGTVEGVLPEPEPSVFIDELGDSSISLHCYGWVDQTRHDFFKVRTLAMRRVKEVFDDKDIDMPEPTFNVRMEEKSAKPSSPARPGPVPAVLDDVGVDRSIHEVAERNREEPSAAHDLLAGAGANME